jgi:hypothetical protein
MNALRWILGTIGGVFGVGFVFLAIIGSGFRKSFGASENNPLLVALPVLGIVLLLAAIFFPTSKPLLHTAAAAALGLVGYFVWQIFKEAEAPFWFAIAYLAAWFVYYWLAAWRSVSPS